jgi:hypothetical protein
MTCQLRFTIDPTVSCYHAVDLVLRGRQLADAGLRDALAAPVKALKGVLGVDHIPPLGLMEHVVPLSHGAEGMIELSRMSLSKAAGPQIADARFRRYADLLEPVVVAWRQELPRIDQAFPVRRDWLADQWAEHGAALLGLLAGLTEKHFLVAEAQVFLVHPVTGGGGAPHLRYRSARIEAVAANPDPALPEVTRLAWLVASLNLLLPRYTDRFPTLYRCWAIGQRALIPVVVAASKESKITADAGTTIEAAARAWLPDPEPDLAANLEQWWSVYQDTRPKWPLALAALDRLLR